MELYILNRHEVEANLPTIMPMLKKSMDYRNELSSVENVVVSLLSGVTRLAIASHNSAPVACLGWSMLDYPKGRVGKVHWFAAHEWGKHITTLANKMENFFAKQNVDVIEIWCRPGLEKLLKEKGFTKWEVGMAKRLNI